GLPMPSGQHTNPALKVPSASSPISLRMPSSVLVVLPSTTILPDLAPGDHSSALLEIKGRALHLLLAAGGKRAGVDGEKSDFERLRGLGKCRLGWQRGEGGAAREKPAA